MVKKNIWRSIQKIKCVGWGMVKYVPLRMSAFDMLGDSTISSMGFPVGSVCRDRRMYDSSYALLELCGKKQGQKLSALDRVHLPATQRVGGHRWNNRHKSQSLRRCQSSNRMRSRINVLGAGELKHLPKACTHFTSTENDASELSGP